MDYIPVYEGEDEDSGIVSVSPGKVQRTGVRSEPAQRRPVIRSIRVPGTLQVDERRISVVATRSDAYLEEVAEITVGDRVKKGQVLVRLYSQEIAAASAQFLSSLDARSAPNNGARQRLENLGVSDETIAEIVRTRKVPLSVTWRAPQDGIVLARDATPGMKMAAGEVLFRLADIRTLWVLADVPEFELGSVQIGSPARVRIRSRLNEALPAQVTVIYPELNEATRTAKVRLEIANPDQVLLLNMYAEIEIDARGNGPVLAVPEGAVIETGTRQVIIIDRGEGRFEPQEVKTGQRGNGYVEIRDGISEGDRVVTAANFLIDAESNLKAALSGMTDAKAAP
jgi:Cu(I)/Ag(I) efflux system membrane fusion protein